MHPPLLTLQHSSFLVTQHFILFNFLLFFLILFLLCNLPPLIQPLHHLPPLNPSSCLLNHHHSPPCILPLLHPPSPTHHPLHLSSLGHLILLSNIFIFCNHYILLVSSILCTLILILFIP